MPVFDSAIGDVQWWATPNYDAALFGGSGSSMQEEGTLGRYVAPSPGASPASLAADVVLFSLTLPAKAFDGAVIPSAVAGQTLATLSNRGISISAQGGFGATSNNKRIKIIVGATSAAVGQAVVGGTTVADTTTITTSGGGWSIGAALYKYGAAGSNTQVAVHQPSVCGGAVSTLASPTYLTLNESAPINICVTGNATTALSDIFASLVVLTGTN